MKKKGNACKKLNLEKLQISKIKNPEEIMGGYVYETYTCWDYTIFWEENHAR
ncbi:hypothetical protein [Aquimarina pacifica]|uniref:hypothetical protein n=1 Tax=Aquimarina pacifica TaxID=1296415 RepID=UPI0004B13B67|nr:hypothetical protein [Aquimarina pacifica]